MSRLNQLFKVFILLSMTTVPHLLLGQFMSTSCQTVTDALIGPDRNDFVHNDPNFPINEGYLHNFTPPSFPCDPGVTSLLITIDITSITTIPECDGTSLFGNVLRNCALTTSAVCNITEDVLTTGCGSFGGGQTTPGIYSLDLANCEAVNNSDIIGVDIIPSVGGACAGTSAITDGDIALTYQICIQYTYDQDIIPVDPGNCDDGDCSNGIETYDGCGCVVSTPPLNGCTDPTANNYNPSATCDDGSCNFDCPDPGTCDDGLCANGVETWDEDLCDCISGTPPTPCVSDGDCTNGFEFYNTNTCECEILPETPGCTDPTASNYNPAAVCDDGSCIYDCPDPGNCDDGNCTNGEEAWDEDLCDCVAGTPPVNPGNCDDGDCTNGVETWDEDLCACIAGTPPVNPGNCDDGDCTNGIETWDGCDCIAGTPPVDPGNCDDGICSNGVETWDGCDCVAGTPPVDPGNCDDGDCTNGIETWDGCDCVAGTPPVDPGNCDDGICSNGVETWDGCNCIAGTPPVNPGNCDDGDCTNGIETWDGCDCVAGTPPVDPGNCDDGICSNGVETWDGCNCIAGTPPVNPGNCDDGDCTNGIETWDGCDCVAGTPPVDPGNCDDGICSNGIETWDGCNCIAGTPPIVCVDDGDCTNGFEVWNTNTCECDITPPVNGCTNPTATNYNPAATCDDGSCEFSCPDPGTCDDGICGNGIETWDGDLCECIAGTPPVDPVCDDGDCSNGIETWDGCDCVAGTPPIVCVDDGDCSNGFEMWNANTCECDITPPVNGCTNPTANNYNPAATCDDGSCEFDCPDPGICDDGLCANGVETWDEDLCECVAGIAPVDPGCSDGDCTNGIETWDGCDCVAGIPPTPCVDDNDCTNGFEMWNVNTCECDITPPVNGCTDPTANNYNPAATCDDGSCEFDCPDPGTCDDADCSNGIETWDEDLCECVAGTPPTPCVDDGDCTNGFEMWNLNTCECDIVAPINGCTNPTANNYNPAATCDDGSCEFDCPDPGTCDDADCSNGIETWDGDLCECVAGIAPVDPGCDDGNCLNGIETWNGCECEAGIAPVDPGCDDGNCLNGVETWNGCECEAGTPPTVCTDDDDCTNGFEVWNLNTCECDITAPVNGCTNPTADNYNPAATCDDGSCEFPCPDPGTCDDADCSNGIETWDGDSCECVAGIAPVDPGCDDGDCTNGLETWNGCDCETVVIDCDNGSTSVVECDDNNANTANDMQTILDCDGSICVPCEGIICDIVAIIPQPSSTITCGNLEDGLILEGTGSTIGTDIIYEWRLDGQSAGTGLSIEVFTDGIYTLQVTDNSTTCTNSTDINITINAVYLNPQVDIFPVSCPGQNDGSFLIDTVLGGTPPYLYSFNSNTFSTDNLFENLAEGSYDLAIQDANGCDTTIVVDIFEANSLFVDLGGDENIKLGDSIELNALNNLVVDTIIWEATDSISCLDCPNPTVMPFSSAVYSVTIIDTSGCSVTDRLTVFVDGTKNIFMPTAFSPNNDGINDKFIINAGSDVSLISNFMIFDRWGEELYSKTNFPPNDSEYGWDGLQNGQEIQAGVYVYFAQVLFVDGRTEVIRGDVTLLK